MGKVNNYADTLAALLALLSHPSEISDAAGAGVTSRSVIFVIDEFDLFTTHARQTLLYNLFDIAQARKAPIAILGLTSRIDVVESLEKRVKSRFSHRSVYLSLPKSLPAYWDICRQGLAVDLEDMDDEGPRHAAEGAREVPRLVEREGRGWSKSLGRQTAFCCNRLTTSHTHQALYKTAAFQERLEFHYYSSKSVPDLPHDVRAAAGGAVADPAGSGDTVGRASRR